MTILKTRGGDFNSFFTSCITLTASCLALWIFARWAEPRWTGHWESFLRKDVREHSPIGTMGWKAFHRTALYPMFALLPVLWMSAAYCLQRVLPEKLAKGFNLVHTLVFLALAVTVAAAFVRLLNPPG